MLGKRHQELQQWAREHPQTARFPYTHEHATLLCFRRKAKEKVQVFVTLRLQGKVPQGLDYIMVSSGSPQKEHSCLVATALVKLCGKKHLNTFKKAAALSNALSFLAPQLHYEDHCPAFHPVRQLRAMKPDAGGVLRFRRRENEKVMLTGT